MSSLKLFKVLARKSAVARVLCPMQSLDMNGNSEVCKQMSYLKIVK